MEGKRRADWSRAGGMGQWTPVRRQRDWTVRIVVACCVALFFLSPGFSRMLPNESTTYLRRSAVLERRSMMAGEVARRSEMRERISHAVVDGEVDTGRKRAEDDLTNDYSTPTHNHNGEDESPSPPASKTTGRSRGSQQFSRYTAQFGHRHLRGV